MHTKIRPVGGLKNYLFERTTLELR
ncbi:MAG: hypothetical protein IBGAMO2_560014 [Arenicellales bacterium IbO2]|nr:MAG: hypothetical protein IBGAMO2_560014 [Arenicellales bacterium IbO2]